MLKMLSILSHFIIVVLSEYVADHWMDEDFYGFQFLNGVNPTELTRCTKLPANFPVTEAMVKPFLDGCSLRDEMKVCHIWKWHLKKKSFSLEFRWDLGKKGGQLDFGHFFFLNLQKGNIFIFDAKMLDGVPVREYNGKPLHVTPGLCLLHVNSDNKLLPIAIQVFSW